MKEIEAVRYVTEINERTAVEQREGARSDMIGNGAYKEDGSNCEIDQMPAKVGCTKTYR
jgi:hypothetical protein